MTKHIHHMVSDLPEETVRLIAELRARLTSINQLTMDIFRAGSERSLVEILAKHMFERTIPYQSFTLSVVEYADESGAFVPTLLRAKYHFNSTNLLPGEDFVTQIGERNSEVVEAYQIDLRDPEQAGKVGYMVVHERRTIYSTDTAAKPKNRRMQSYTTAPIISANSQVLGTISLGKVNAADDYEELEVQTANCIAASISAVLPHLFYGNIIPMCSKCHYVRDDTGVEHGKGTWTHIADYLQHQTGKAVSHGLCPPCREDALRELEASLPSGSS